MNSSRFTEEQIIAILQGQEAGSKKADVCRKHGVSSPTFDRVYPLPEGGECQISDLGTAHILVELVSRVISVAIVGGMKLPGISCLCVCF